MSLKEGALYRCDATGTVVMVVKIGNPETTLSTDSGQMELHQPGMSDKNLASGLRVKPGTIVRQEIRVAHELADPTHPRTGVDARLEWSPGEKDDKGPKG